MSSKEELYRALIESAPYGTLFIVYGVCIEANSKAFEQLECNKKQLIGSSLDEITGDESSPLIDLKLQLKKSIKNASKSFNWLPPGGGSELKVDLLFVNDSEKEIVVTLNGTIAISSPDGGSIAEQETLSVPQVSSQNPVTSEPSVENEPSAENESSPSALDQNPNISDATASQKEASPKKEASPSPYESLVQQLISDSSPPTNPQPLEQQHSSVVSGEYYFDKLTGLPNRLSLLQKVDEFFAAGHGSVMCGAMLMINLDHFRSINNSLGRRAGDRLLKKMARTIAAIATGDQLLSRLSGDEFVLFVPRISEELSDAVWEVQALAEQVRELVAAPQNVDGQEIYLTASIGIAMLHDSGLDAENVLQLAEQATHEAKRKGRNSISFFDPSLTERAHRDVDLSNRLRRALDNQEFVLFVQPQLSVETGEVMGGEVLLRWMSSDRVTSMPSEFIPLLEKSGLIVDVGRWVIRTSCEYLRNLIDDGLWKPHMRLGVNISPRQFHDPQLVDVIEHSVESYGVDPRYLNFEITENLVIEDVDDAIIKMEKIKELGSMFSIDDFGIGYSSMIYLKRLPLDHLKIDREFIRNIDTDEDNRGVVEAIMAVSRQYGLEVTAEGVENSESLNVIKGLGCNIYQGAHYSMPVPYLQFKRMLAA